MLARPSDGQLARRQPFASTSGPASTSAPPMRSSTQPTSGGSASSATSLNIRPARLVGSEGTAYEAMCKRVLSRRLLRAFSLAFFTTLAIWSTSLSLTGGLGLTPSVANVLRNTASSAAVFVACVLPTLVLRKLLITQPELVTSSATARFRILAGAGSSRTAAAVFAACGGLLAFFWALVMQLAVPTVKLGLLASTSKHPVLLNERYIIVILSNASLGLAYAVRELWTEAFLPKWPRDILALQGLILGRLASRVPSALGLPVLHSVGFSAVYLALRKPVLRFFLSWFGVLVRPYVATFLRPTHKSLNLGLFGRLVILELMTVALWEAAKALIDVYMVQPMLISHHSAAPTKCLLAGLAAPSDYIRHFAQFELAHLAVTAPDRRRKIFADMSTPSTAWAELWRTEMVLLGKSYQALRTGGLPAVSTSVASSGAPAASASGPTSDGPTQKHLVPKSDPAIFKHAPKTMYDSLSSGPTQSAQPAPALAPPPTRQAPSTPSTVPAIFTQKSQASQAPTQPPARQYAPSTAAPSMLATVRGYALKIWWAVYGRVPGEMRAALESNLAPIRQALVRETIKGQTRAPLPNRDVDMLTIQTLSALISASLAEDPYGQVQGDIPRTLEALTAYLGVLESLYARVQASAGAEGSWPERQTVTMAILKEDVEPVLDATREGIRQIVQVFRDHLASAFRFPPDVVKALEEFL